MLEASAQQILDRLAEDDLVLDVGGWAQPFGRADWVLDLMPYSTRGLYGETVGGAERFSEETWVCRDICDREPWPFADDQFDFAICSHTLEDVRDPLWVCSELARVAAAGYIEVPSRLEEQCFGVHGPWVGWSHHHWLTEVSADGLEFVFKPGVLQGHDDMRFPPGVAGVLDPEERVETLFWEDSFDSSERIFFEAEELHDYLRTPVAAHADELRRRLAAADPGRARRAAGRLKRRLGGARGA